MHTGRGVFIVIEGTDGSGKGTQLERLAERLRTDGYDVATFDFPQYDEASSYFVRQYLNGKYGTADEIGPYTGSLFYALDRFEAGPKIKEAIEQGKVVLANRYVGSNMAHQGTKFRHAEERRGYFIWLDNLEFEMLGIPRPTLSVVLRVPAEVAQQLVDQKATRTYTDKKRDIHEADLAHLQKSVEVYTDMCQLFPKDFSLIEGTRDGQLLSIDEVHNIIWQKVIPLLPAKKAQGAISDKSASITATEQITSTSGSTVRVAAIESKLLSKQQRPFEDSTNGIMAVHILVENCSSLLAQKLEQAHLTGYAERPTAPRSTNQSDNATSAYYIPETLDNTTREQYVAHMDQISSLHTTLVDNLTEYLRTTDTTPPHGRDIAWETTLKTRAYGILRSTLPIAATSTVGLLASNEQLIDLVTQLLSDPLDEVRKVGRAIFEEVQKSDPTLLKQLKPENISHSYDRVAALAGEYLPSQHTDGVTSVQLVEICPRNELDLVADILYEHSSSPLKELQHISSEWSYEQKSRVLEAYLAEWKTGGSQTGSALEKVRYSWDLLCEYQASREMLHNLNTGHFKQQALTPRYGYEVPKLIEEANLVDQYEACFELSLKLYSLLQEAGYVPEAQYATLMGHKLRLKATCSIREASLLSATTQTYQNVVQSMHEQIAEAHPILSENANS